MRTRKMRRAISILKTKDDLIPSYSPRFVGRIRIDAFGNAIYTGFAKAAAGRTTSSRVPLALPCNGRRSPNC